MQKHSQIRICLTNLSGLTFGFLCTKFFVGGWSNLNNNLIDKFSCEKKSGSMIFHYKFYIIDRKQKTLKFSPLWSIFSSIKKFF